MLETCEKCTFNPGETMVREGGTGAYLYVIIDGEVSVLKSSGGRGAELARLQPGNSFGEISLVDHGQRSASVIALQP